MSKKYVLPALCFGWVCLGANLVGDPGPYVIDTLQNTDQTWEIDAENLDNNTVTFAGEGAVSVETTEDIPAAINVTYPGKDAAAENGLLTLNFQNEPKIDVFVNKLDQENKPIIGSEGNPEQENVGSAHVFAYGKNTNATALHLADGVNLELTGDADLFPELTKENLVDQKRVGIFAYSESVDQNHTAIGIELEGKAEGEPPSTEGFDQTLTFTVPVEICVQSDNAVAAIGQANANGSLLLKGSIKYNIGNNNEFLATCSSGVVIGASAGEIPGYGSVSVSGNSVYEIGNNNTLSATSSSSSDSDSSVAVIGASAGCSGRTEVKGDNVYEIGDYNTLIASSSGSCSSAVIMGASAGLVDNTSTRRVSVSGSNTYKIGKHNILSTVSSGSSLSTTIIGASVGKLYNNAPTIDVFGSHEIAINSENVLSTLSEAT